MIEEEYRKDLNLEEPPAMSMTVTFYGVRPGIPSCSAASEWSQSLEELLRYFFEANHSQPEHLDTFWADRSTLTLQRLSTASFCVDVSTPTTSLVINAGSGIKSLGDDFMKIAPKSQGERWAFHLLITKSDYAHLMGLPFFVPLFLPKTDIHFYSTDPQLLSAIRFLFERPYFPVAFNDLPSRRYFHTLHPEKKLTIADLHITPIGEQRDLATMSYRIAHGDGSYLHLTNEHDLRRLATKTLNHSWPYNQANLSFLESGPEDHSPSWQSNTSLAPLSQTLLIPPPVETAETPYFSNLASPSHCSYAHEGQIIRIP